MGKQKVVLAFSGGLDTSFCVKYLSEDKGYDVYTAIANTGGFSKEELANIEKRALALGAVKHATLDIEQEYYEKSIKYMIYGDILRNGTYPISVSSERIFQAIAIIEYAKSVGADCVAHGSTGAGNDQVRFDLTFQVLAPEIEIITPTRDMTLTREYEINYLREHGFEADFKKMEYSINKGLWGTSIGGKETLRSEQTLPETVKLRTGTASPNVQLCASFRQPWLYFIGKSDFSATEAMRYNYETGQVDWDYITADIDGNHEGGSLIYGYMGVHPTTEQLWVGKSSYTNSRIHVYDVSRSDAVEYGSYYQKKASPAGVDFAYRFTEEWINR